MKKICNDSEANVIFGEICNISVDFEEYINTFFEVFSKQGITVESINKYGLIAIQAGFELIKNIKKLESTSSEEFDNLVLNSIVLVYGYCSAFNQIIDEGFIAEGLKKKLEEYSKTKNIKLIALISDLDSKYNSLWSKMYTKAIEITKDKQIVTELNKILKVSDLFDDGKMLEVAAKLDTQYKKTNLMKSESFKEYLNLFSKNYFQLLSATKFLQQIFELKCDPKVDCLTKKLVNCNEVEQIYFTIKKWKDISGIEINKNQLRLYFDIFPSFAEKNKMRLYAPIKLFLRKAKSKVKKYTKNYNLENLNEAKMEFDSWNYILE